MACSNHPSLKDILEIKRSRATQSARNSKKQPIYHNDEFEITISRTHRMTNKMWEERGHIDLSSPAAWGKFAHAAYQDAFVEEGMSVPLDIERSVTIEKPDGSIRRGRIDALTQDGRLIEIKTNKLERKSDSQLYRMLDEISVQIEQYIRSPDAPQALQAVVLFEFRPHNASRRTAVEQYFGKRGIEVEWGIE